MKKFVSRLLILVLVTFSLSAIFVGCGKQNGKIKVSIGMWPDSTLKSDVAMFTKWKERFEADYPEYEIVAQPYTYSPDTVSAAAMSRTLPTVFQTYFTEPQKLINNGYIRPITSLLKELGWYDKMDVSMRNALTSDGEVYGIPRDGYGMGLFINLKMLYEVGVLDKNDDGSYKLYDESNEPLYPTTFEEIAEVSRIVCENRDNTYGLVVLSANKQGGWQFTNMAWNFGAEHLQVQQGGKWKANLNDPGAVKALEWIKQMKDEELIYPGASLSYADWYGKIGSNNVAMAFAGSDAIAMPVTNYNFPKDDIAFVPMPTGDGTSRYSLYGGTPFVFAPNASDEQVRGAMLFLKYMGRSPETDEISKMAMEEGNQTAQAKGMPIIPTIKPWINSDYLELANALEQQYVNVNMDYFKDFFDAIDAMKKDEEPNFCQDMYACLDRAIQSVLSNSNANCQALLDTENSNFQRTFLDKM